MAKRTYLISILVLSIFAGQLFVTKSVEAKFLQNIKMGGSNQDSGFESDDMIEIVKFVLEHYKLDNGMYPTTEQGLKALVTKSTASPIPGNWRGPYLGQMPLGPGLKFYNYTCPGARNKNSYDLSLSINGPYDKKPQASPGNK